jgi:hypothetical protein
VSNPAIGALRQSGSLFALVLDVVRSLPKRRPGFACPRCPPSRCSFVRQICGSGGRNAYPANGVVKMV